MKLLKKLAASLCALTMLSSSAAPAALAANAAAEGETVKVMCLGDSITDGFMHYPGAYRVELCYQLHINGYSSQVDLVGPHSNGQAMYDFDHAGYTGWAIDPFTPDKNPAKDNRAGLSQVVDNILTDNPADIVLLQIGTNDILSAYELDTFGDRLTALADRILAHLDSEDGMLYIATLPPMDANDTTYIKPNIFTVEIMDGYVAQCNQSIKDVVDNLQSQGKNVELADIAGVVTKADLYDGVHPTQAGYEKMGDYWYEIVKSYIDAKNAPAETTTTTTQVSSADTTDTDGAKNTASPKTSSFPTIPVVIIGVVAIVGIGGFIIFRRRF